MKQRRTRIINLYDGQGKKYKIIERSLDSDGFVNARGKEKRSFRRGGCPDNRLGSHVALGLYSMGVDILITLKEYLRSIPEADFDILFELICEEKKQMDVARMLSGDNRNNDKTNKSRVYKCQKRHRSKLAELF